MFAEILASATTGTNIPLWLIAPFGLLLLLIAVMPLSPHAIKSFWEKRYMFVSIGLGLLVAAYYLVNIPGGGGTIKHTLHEYFSFICLIGSLFTVAGGIHIKIKGEASPVENIIFLAFGGVLANFIGTTGASMVLIRPYMRLNRSRLGAYHIVFFIFIVSNMGGALTPIGDPPLFLGYLRGVPFFWLVEHVLIGWLCMTGVVLLVFYAIDRINFKRMPAEVQSDLKEHDRWSFEGTFNAVFLLMIIGGVFLPERYFVREITMLSAALASYLITPKSIHEQNVFNFGPIKEVAYLFAGIFLTMMPALGYLALHGQQFGFTQPLQYYFTTGALSSVLDNAPTYVTFLQLAETSARAADPAAFAVLGDDARAAVRLLLDHKPLYVIAVSLGAVFFGAMTYIGNGPNFMVKSIAENSGVKMPTFFGYVFKYSLPFLLPILAIGGWLFMR